MRTAAVVALVLISAIVGGLLVHFESRLPGSKQSSTAVPGKSTVREKVIQPQTLRLVDRDGAFVGDIHLDALTGWKIVWFNSGYKQVARIVMHDTAYEYSVNFFGDDGRELRFAFPGVSGGAADIIALHSFDTMKRWPEKAGVTSILRKTWYSVTGMVNTQQLRLVDHNGHPFVVLGESSGDPILAFLNPDGEILATWGVQFSSGFLNLFDESGPRVSVQFQEDERPGLHIDEPDDNGINKTYVIDPKTGKEVREDASWYVPVPWLRGPNIPNLPLILTDQDGQEIWRFPAVSQPEGWADIPLPQLGKATASLSTEWKEGRLYYQFSMTPTPTLNAARQRSTRQIGATTLLRAPELGVQLLDKDRFKLIEINLPIPDLLGEVDQHGKEQKLSAQDSIECSLQKYQSIRAWSLAWRL